MMQQSDCPRDLASYLDGELAPDRQLSIQEHIAGCSRCAAEIATIVTMKRSLQPARNHFVPSMEFRRRVQQQIAPAKRTRWQMGPAPAMMMALAALLLVGIAIIGGVSVLRQNNISHAYGELADLHINALASVNPVDVVSTDRHTVKPWFQGRLPFSFNIPEFAGTEFTLLGGRMVYLQQRPGAQLIVNMRQHKISVLIFQEAAEFARALPVTGKAQNRSTFHVETWAGRGLRFVVIGDADAGEIDRLAQALKTAN